MAMQERKENRAAEADDAASGKQLAASEHVRIREIRERAAAATRGPWVPDGCGDVLCMHAAKMDENIIYEAIAVSPQTRISDSEFIAAARDDIPWLLSLIDELSLAATCGGCGEPRAQGPCSRHCDNDA